MKSEKQKKLNEKKFVRVWCTNCGKRKIYLNYADTKKLKCEKCEGILKEY